jgi:hypothetical protein
MELAIMQPTYLPWVGYFDLINSSESFVFLDNVKFEKSSWQTRNRIPINNQPHYLTVPVRGSRNQIIKDVMINDDINWRNKQSATLDMAYKKHPYGRWMLDIVLPLINDSSLNNLSKLNIDLIKSISKAIGMSSDFYLGSEIQAHGMKSFRLIEICHHFGSKRYYSPIGSMDYIEKEGAFRDNNIEVIYQDINMKEYQQAHVDNFISQLSIIDLMANLGADGAKKYIDDLNQVETN